MKIRYFITLGLIVISFVSIAIAQNPAASPQTADEVQELRKKVDAQEQQFKQMQDKLQKQNEVIELQQKQINELIGKFGQKEPAKSTDAPAADKTVAAIAPAGTGPSKPAAKPVTPVESGYGTIKFNGLLQGWFASGDRGFSDTVRIRRAEMKFSGNITPKAKWTVMFDPAKVLSLNNTTATINGTTVVTSTSPNQASRILQDAFITLSYLKNVTVDVGQFKVPLSMEGLHSSAALDTVDRALFMTDRSRGGGLGDVRDIGVMFRGPLTKNFDYQIGFFNGVGENQNDTDKNDQKAIIGRFVFHPTFVKGVQVGMSGAYGNGKKALRKDRFGGELAFVRDKFTFKSEVMGGVDGDTHRLGYYAHFGYRIMPKVEGIFRFDGFDPNRRLETASANVTERDYIVGLNYFIRENRLKLQVNYIRKTFNNGIAPSRNLFLANLQTSW